jgi:predicted secreted Zn-dependent protease
MDADLQKAKTLCDTLPSDIQCHITEEYIVPKGFLGNQQSSELLRGDDLIKEFDALLMSNDCQSLRWQVLPEIVSKIIENKSALAQMFEKYEDVGFKQSYEQHFIKGVNTFKQPCWGPLSSMCAELTMRKWH